MLYRTDVILLEKETKTSQPGVEPGSRVPETLVLPLHHWDVLAWSKLLMISPDYIFESFLKIRCPWKPLSSCSTTPPPPSTETTSPPAGKTKSLAQNSSSRLNCKPTNSHQLEWGSWADSKFKSFAPLQQTKPKQVHTSSDVSLVESFTSPKYRIYHSGHPDRCTFSQTQVERHSKAKNGLLCWINN